MTTFSGIYDTKLTIWKRNGEDISVGHYSTFTDNINKGTGTTVDGWRWDDRIWPGEDSDYNTTVPLLSDPDLSMVDTDQFQSGVGGGTDCFMEDIQAISTSGINSIWAPKINHGYFYDFDDEYYLYSDGVRTQFILNSGITVSGWNTVRLAEYPKIGPPILSRTYEWVSNEGKYKVYKNFKKRIDFTGRRVTEISPRLETYDTQTEQILYDNVDTTESEFIILQSGTNFPELIFNSNNIVQVGTAVTSLGDLSNLEFLGDSTGVANQIFYTKYSPIEPNAPLEVYSYDNAGNYYGGTLVEEWGNIVGEYKLDKNLGIFYANPHDVIPLGWKLYVRYTYTAEIQYEPEFTTDKILAFNDQANINPVTRSSNHGFVLIKNRESQPASLVLNSEETEISENLFGPLNIGNNFSSLIATVTSDTGELLENIPVTFNILDNPSIGLFTNGLTLSRSNSDGNGIASIYYAPPLNIDEIGEILPASQYSVSGGDTTLTTTSLKITGDEEDIFLFKVYKDDPILGIDLGSQADFDAGIITSELDDYYTDFFIEESIYGPTGLAPGAITSSGSDLQTGASAWESRHRALTGLLTPTNFNRELRNGRKQIVSYYSTTAANPHYEDLGAFIPLQPSLVNVVSTYVNDVIFEDTVLDPPGVGDLDSYFLVSPTTVRIQASTINSTSGEVIVSNIIEIQLKIPDHMNGLVNIDSINTIPSGIVPYMLSSQHNDRILPLGFRIRSTSITLASALEGVTFIDINQEPILMNVFDIQVSGQT